MESNIISIPTKRNATVVFRIGPIVCTTAKIAMPMFIADEPMLLPEYSPDPMSAKDISPEAMADIRRTSKVRLLAYIQQLSSSVNERLSITASVRIAIRKTERQCIVRVGGALPLSNHGIP